jgi:hypothetical protein
MDLAQQLLDIERKLWTNDAAFYHSHLIDESLEERVPFLPPSGSSPGIHHKRPRTRLNLQREWNSSHA